MKSIEQIARELYEAYAAARIEHSPIGGGALAPWSKLPACSQSGWIAAARKAADSLSGVM